MVSARDYVANRSPVPRGTLTQLFLDTVDRFGTATAFRAITQEGFSEISCLEMLDRVRWVAGGLQALGVEGGDRVAILSENRQEWSQADFGVLSVGGLLVPIHTTLTAAQIGYILKDSGARVVFLSTSEQMEKVEEVTASWSEPLTVVSFDALPSDSTGAMSWDDFLRRGKERAGESTEEAFRASALSIDPDDPASLIYTSGTTGDPKGVVLTHNNLFSNVAAVGKAVPVDTSDSTLSFLPLSHVFQRMVDLYFFSAGAVITYARSLRTVAEDLRRTRPTKVAGAPRVYEKFYMAILDQSGVKGFLVRWAREVGEAWAEETLSGRKPTWILRSMHRLAHLLVFRKIHDAVGGRLIFFFSGSAPLAPHINKFFYAAGIKILEGYGLTETSPGITMTSLEKFRIGTVGPPIPGTEIKLAQDGEILVKGPQVMKEYYCRPEETEAAFDEEGWFKTGDIGEITEDGYLTITDRKKNILVTAGGKNVAPAPIENLVKANPFVDQVVMVGDGRNFPALLVVPDFQNLEAWARSNGLHWEERRDLLRDTRTRERMGKEIFGLLGDLASYERPKKIGLIQEEFTIEGGIMTPNQKVKRRVILERYGPLIQKLYDPSNRRTDVLVEEDE